MVPISDPRGFAQQKAGGIVFKDDVLGLMVTPTGRVKFSGAFDWGWQLDALYFDDEHIADADYRNGMSVSSRSIRWDEVFPGVDFEIVHEGYAVRHLVHVKRNITDGRTLRFVWKRLSGEVPVLVTDAGTTLEVSGDNIVKSVSSLKLMAAGFPVTLDPTFVDDATQYNAGYTIALNPSNNPPYSVSWVSPGGAWYVVGTKTTKEAIHTRAQIRFDLSSVPSESSVDSSSVQFKHTISGKVGTADYWYVAGQGAASYGQANATGFNGNLETSWCRSDAIGSANPIVFSSPRTDPLGVYLQGKAGGYCHFLVKYKEVGSGDFCANINNGATTNPYLAFDYTEGASGGKAPGMVTPLYGALLPGRIGR